jgi:hypothetical protein
VQPTTFTTYSVPGAASALTTPLTIARGYQVAVRVLVKNVGAVPIFLAGADQDVVTAEGPSSKTWQLDPASAEVFVLAPKQLMFAVGSVPGGKISVSVSEALPVL